ncbi:hypothetical protein [Streptomyces sp. NBC_00439]|uniref:hypothetical protein n=1 Tax=Streptomyces sp. NBC_00439 TaxID=2903650 RepID=UPI0022504440|nr:hypothetical protein [Streptomyces sp. NBC_00439]MCX5106945.1 hypothetical protein [Streptomyces sp. NBC_00439]
MTHRTSPTARIAQQLAPFARHPQRWERERTRAARSGHVCGDAGCDPVLIRERTRWGWIDWTVPADGGLPDRPFRIAVLTPTATRAQRLGLRWLARRPARRIQIGAVPVRTSTVGTAILSLAVATAAAIYAAPLSIVLAAAASATMLVEHLPHHLDDRAGENIRIAENAAACGYLQRLSALHTGIIQAAANSSRYELWRAVEIGHHQLFDTATLLRSHDTLSVSAELIARERLMLQLAVQTSRIAASTKNNAPPA